MLALLALGGGAVRSAAGTGTCAAPGVSSAYAHSVRAALSAKHDVWGRRLLAAPGGPSYEHARAALAPLLYATGRGGKKLTDSGVYYLPFAFPFNVNGSRLFALHVADGSQIVIRRAGGPSVTVDVGPDGNERYGSCLGRLGSSTLADGYLPILDTSYTDSAGVRYDQESFVGRLFGSISLSFVHLHVDATDAAADITVRLVPSPGGLLHDGNQLLSHGSTRLVWAGDGSVADSAVSFDIPAGTEGDVYAGVPSGPNDGRLLQMGQRTYDTARAVVSSFWQARLDDGTVFDVPDEQVGDAERALLVQELLLAWRYSAGNPYEELSFAEAADVARVMAAYGHADVAQTILRFAMRRLPERFTNWRAGALLVAHADLYRLARDRPFLNDETPKLAQLVRAVGRQIDESSTGLLAREPYSSDIAREVYALHGQAVVWQGLASLGRVWSQTGHPQLAARCRVLAARLHTGLVRAIARSERRTSDGSIFVPAALLAGERPYPNLALSRKGTYWNLVMPYALASGLLPPHGRVAHGVLRYLLDHGGRLLGLVRAGATRLYGQYPPAPDVGHRPGVRRQRRAVPRRRRSARPARPLALRHARHRDDPGHVRGRGERERDAVARAPLPHHVPAPERRSERCVSREPAPAAGARDARPPVRPARTRARVLDAEAVARGRAVDRRRGCVDELRSRLVLALAPGRLGGRHRRRAELAAAGVAAAAAAAAARRAHRGRARER